MTEMNIPIADSSNPSIVTQDIQAYLRSHSDIDGVLTLGSAIATDAMAAVKALGKDGKIKIGTNGNSTAEMQAVKSGRLSWIVDAQQYLQGFYSLQIAVQYVRYGMHPGQPVYTGGLVIRRDNVDQALAVQEKFKGIRGAA
jgi:simple sugar transport system substrate-binding protein